MGRLLLLVVTDGFTVSAPRKTCCAALLLVSSEEEEELVAFGSFPNFDDVLSRTPPFFFCRAVSPRRRKRKNLLAVAILCSAT